MRSLAMPETAGEDARIIGLQLALTTSLMIGRLGVFRRGVGTSLCPGSESSSPEVAGVVWKPRTVVTAAGAWLIMAGGIRSGYWWF